jgi:site-specific recombinase XerD
MLKIVQRGKKGIWQIVGTCPLTGRSIRQSTGTDSQGHAEAQRIQLETRLLDERTFGKRSTATFAEALNLYQSKGYSLRFTGPLTRHFHDWQLSDITDLEVSKFCQLTYPEASPQTVNRQVYTPLISIWRVAEDAGLCAPHRFKRPKQPEREAVTFATEEEIAKLLEAGSDRLRAAILVLTYTGARASEVCRLYAVHIDWAAQKVTFRKTKGGKPRQVALTPMTMEALLPLRTVTGPLLGFAQRYSLNQAIERACARAGLRHMASHEIGRHAFAARLLRQGKTLKEVQEAGGWSAKSMWMVAEIYAHLERSTTDAAVRDADKELRELQKPEERKKA